MRPGHKVPTQSRERKTLPSRVSAFNLRRNPLSLCRTVSNYITSETWEKFLKNCPAGRNSAGTFKQTFASYSCNMAQRQPRLCPAYCMSCSVERKLGSQRLKELVIYVSCRWGFYSC